MCMCMVNFSDKAATDGRGEITTVETRSKPCDEDKEI